MGDGIRRIRRSLATGDSAPYMHQIRLPDQLPELLPDIQPPIPYVVRDRMTSRLMPRSFRHVDGNIELFISGPRTGFSTLHYDLYHQHAFIAHVFGEKHFRVFSPSDSPHVYVNPEHPHTSQVPDAFNLDLGRFPLMSRATPIDFVLRPGEVLFVPAGWWHVTRMHEVTISVAWNTLDRSNWPGFVADYQRGVRSEGARGRLKAAYVQALGPLFSARGM
jgi:histone arginine demethylase JMJD6